jgi:hypothetical protein
MRGDAEVRALGCCGGRTHDKDSHRRAERRCKKACVLDSDRVHRQPLERCGRRGDAAVQFFLPMSASNGRFLLT